MKATKSLVIYCFVFWFYTDVVFAAEVPIDLSTWEQRGNPSSGSWNVSSDGTSVTQTINGGPTFFVGGDESLNKTYSGTFRVNHSDDDFIGFVFGFSEPNADHNQFDFLLFDWKKSQQAEDTTGVLALEGFTLSRVQGFVEDISANETGTQGFWNHTHSSITVLDSSYGPGLGWQNNTSYDFTLVYQDDRISIDIDGVNIFDISSNNNPSGAFGFYNFSQPYVTYTGFTQKDTPPVPIPGAIWLFGSALTGLAVLRRKKK